MCSHLTLQQDYNPPLLYHTVGVSTSADARRMTLLSRVAASQHLGVDRVPIANCTGQKCTESDTKTKEGEKEKRTWLRGLLLGISMSLLLMGGVALAQGITITTDPEGCLECYEGELPNFLALRSSGSSATSRNAKASSR